MDKRHWPALVLLQCFALLSCWGRVFLQHVTVDARFILSIISVVFSLQMFVSDHGWRCIPLSVKPDLGPLISTLLKSKAGSAAKRYKKEILKFIDYCISSGVRPVLPFPVSFIVTYLLRFIRVLAHMRL